MGISVLKRWKIASSGGADTRLEPTAAVGTSIEDRDRSLELPAVTAVTAYRQGRRVRRVNKVTMGIQWSSWSTTFFSATKIF